MHLGCNVIIEKIAGKQSQTFLEGHTDFVSCVAVSKSGRFIASGQQTHMGFDAEIIIWDYLEKKEVRRLKLHRVKVQALAFSPSEGFLASLGGEDDGKVAFWNLETGKALCTAPTGDGRGGFAEAIAFCNNTDNVFMTGGDNTLSRWNFNPETQKMARTPVVVRGLKRVIKCMVITPDDQTLYCGTTTGDVVAIVVDNAVLRAVGPKRVQFELGVISIAIDGNGDLLVGDGSGQIALVKPTSWNVSRKMKVGSHGVSSVALRGAGHEFFIGLENSTIHRVSHSDFTVTQRSVAYSAPVTDVCFPEATSELFGTCGGAELRVWHTDTRRELLRISLPCKIATCMEFLPNGAAIISGWNDGAIRIHLPESGRMVCEVPNANGKGVTALAPLNDNKRLLTGGGDGQVRLWTIGSQMKLDNTLKEHSAKITSIMVSAHLFATLK